MEFVMRTHVELQNEFPLSIINARNRLYVFELNANAHHSHHRTSNLKIEMIKRMFKCSFYTCLSSVNRSLFISALYTQCKSISVNKVQRSSNHFFFINFQEHKHHSSVRSISHKIKFLPNEIKNKQSSISNISNFNADNRTSWQTNLRQVWHFSRLNSHTFRLKEKTSQALNFHR